MTTFWRGSETPGSDPWPYAWLVADSTGDYVARADGSGGYGFELAPNGLTGEAFTESDDEDVADLARVQAAWAGRDALRTQQARAGRDAVVVSLRVPAALYRRVKACAAVQRVSLNLAGAQALELWIARYGAPEEREET